MIFFYYVFRDLDNTETNNMKKYRKSLFSCLLVNKLRCEVIITTLQNYPYKYIQYYSILFYIYQLISIKLLINENIIIKKFQKTKTFIKLLIIFIPFFQVMDQGY